MILSNDLKLKIFIAVYLFMELYFDSMNLTRPTIINIIAFDVSPSEWISFNAKKQNNNNNNVVRFHFRGVGQGNNSKKKTFAYLKIKIYLVKHCRSTERRLNERPPPPPGTLLLLLLRL